MKQNIAIGAMVDDGSGDYLRRGGQKINENFDELYFQLGDGENPHAAGAWKTHTVAEGVILAAEFGHSYAVDSTSGRITVNLPKGSVVQYNYVIRLRDVFSTWQLNPVTVVPAVGDTMKGSPDPVEFNANFTDLELVYCSPGRWEYVTNKRVDRITSNDVSTVDKQQYIATAGQTDFIDIFDHDYNTANFGVYHRGNLLFYGKDGVFDPVNAEYGSIGPNPGELVPLDGKTVRLRNACTEGDTVIIETFMDGIGQYRSSYNRREVRILDQKYTNERNQPGSIIVADLSTKLILDAADLGLNDGAGVNPSSCEVSLNSILQHQAGTVGLPAYICVGGEGDDPNTCSLNGGTWTQSATDYVFVTDDITNEITGIRFDKPFEHGDVVSVIWYNNNIGTTLELEDIINETDNLYISSGPAVPMTGLIRILDENNPFSPNVEELPASEIKINSVGALFDMFHPVGTIYENTANPNNPSTYMGGLGIWTRLSDRVTVGWSPVAGSKFNVNNNDLDALGNPSATAGGTGGHDSVTLVDANIPTLKTDDKVLVSDPNGLIVIGGCLVDPDAQGPAYTKYREDNATINKAYEAGARPVDVMPPYVTVYRWVRVA